MESNGTQFKSGLKDGIPIGLGYLAVSFTFGIMASGAGLNTWQAVVMSFTNLTSAGQFAALGIIQAGAPFAEMAVAQLIINLRYCLMSCSLSQKLKAGLPFFHRFLISYGVTDEIFGVSVCRPGMLSPFYSYGLMCVAVPGWTLGTLLGAILAVVIPPAKGNRILTCVILVSMVLSWLFTRIPALNHISSGFKIIILTILIAGAAAILFPLKEEQADEP